MPLPEPLTDADRYDAAIETGADLLQENFELKAQARRLRRALKAVLLFHSSDPWTAEKILEWDRLTGDREATTKQLCDMVRDELSNRT